MKESGYWDSKRCNARPAYGQYPQVVLAKFSAKTMRSAALATAAPHNINAISALNARPPKRPAFRYVPLFPILILLSWAVRPPADLGENYALTTV
jgi:hypothetical protein